MHTIRPASLDDIPLIQEMSHEIWHEVYPSVISLEQIGYMLEKMYSNIAIKEQITQLGHHFLLLEAEGNSVGFASYSIKSGSEPGRYRLHKLYIKTNLHGKGLGKSLIRHICSIIINDGALELELNVNKRNPAVSFYEHLGFYREKEVTIDIGEGHVMDDYIMVLNLLQNKL